MTTMHTQKRVENTEASFSLAPLALFPLTRFFEERNRTMAKSLDSMFEMIRSAKHPFRQVANHPDKQHKNRYERRKVKHLLHLGDWEDQAQQGY
jgi:hypothetical protein